MLKEQILKEYKPPSNKMFYILMLTLAFGACAFASVAFICVSRASSLIAVENLTLLDLDKIDINQDYKGTTVKAIEYILKAYMYLPVCIVMTIPLCFARYTRRKQKRILSLINQIPDEI